MRVRLRDICEILDSQRVPITASDRTPGPYPYYGANGVQDYVDDYIFDDELVLLAEDGGNFGSKDKPIAYRVSGKCWVNNHAHVLKPKDCVDVDYLCYSLMFYDVSGLVNGATRKKLTQADMRKMEILLPPLDEQRKIAAVLDKVSELTAKRRRQLDKLDELVESKFVEMFGAPAINSKNWSIIPLGERCDVITGNTPSRAKPENYGNYIEWIKSDNINSSSAYLTKAQEYLSETGFQKCRYVRQGAILMTCIAGSISCIGNVAIANRCVAFNQQINAIVPKLDETLYIYWMLLLSKKAIQSRINKALKGILNKGQLMKMEFPFPPTELQKQFAAWAEQGSKLQSTIQRSLSTLETLKKSLMQKYFG